jgi:hypothetical protein
MNGTYEAIRELRKQLAELVNLLDTELTELKARIDVLERRTGVRK